MYRFKGFFGVSDDANSPPVPDFTDVQSVQMSTKSYETPTPKKTFHEMGTQV